MKIVMLTYANALKKVPDLLIFSIGENYRIGDRVIAR